MNKALLLVAGSLAFVAASAATPASANVILPAPQVSTKSQDAFFDHLRAHCGKAYEGKVAMNNPASSGFEGRLIMHVRKCTDRELQIPFHVGDNHSRTWILTKTGSGISLKHDHRNADGSYDELTMYGGHTIDAGFDRVQSFPADAYSIEHFVDLGLAVSNTNVWQMFIYPEVFTYRLTRAGREFRVEFDLTKPVALPPTPWGYAGN